MTNLEAIKAGKHEKLNEILKANDAEETAEMLSDLMCHRCICKDYCDEVYDYENFTCQKTIMSWLDKEYKDVMKEKKNG